MIITNHERLATQHRQCLGVRKNLTFSASERRTGRNCGTQGIDSIGMKLNTKGDCFELLRQDYAREAS